MSIATTSVQIGRRPSPVTLTDAAAAKVAELLVGEESADSLALARRRPSGWLLGLQLRHVLRLRDRR